MATALPYNPNLECSIYFETYKNPKILSCGHSFCLRCLERYIDGRRGAFPCPVCTQYVTIPRGGVDKFITNFSLKTSTDLPRTTNISTAQSRQPSTSLKHHCPNHSKKEIDYYCQTCNLGLCSKCIFNDHKDHTTLDLELDSTREKVVQELSKSEQFVKKKIEELEKTHAELLETSKKLEAFCDEACIKIRKTTENIIGELKENCEKRQQEIRENFDKNESKVTETRQKVWFQIQNIKTGLVTSRPTTTEGPSLTLMYALTKLQDLQKLCENMKTDIPPVTYEELKEGSVKVCDILGSTVTKPLYQSSEGSGRLATLLKRLYQSREGDSPFTFNNKDINTHYQGYYSQDKCKSQGRVWSCVVLRDNYYKKCLYIRLELLPEDNRRVEYCTINYTLTILNRDEDKNVFKLTSKTFRPGCHMGSEVSISWNKLTDLSEGFVDNEGQFRVRLDILQVLETRNKWWFKS